MNIRIHFSYYLFLLLFPLSFVLHGVNENFGLIAPSVSGRLLLVYVGITLGVAVASYAVLRSRARAFFFSFVFLLIYFLFGLFKDLIGKSGFMHGLNRYTVLMPLLVAGILLLLAYLKRRRVAVDKAAKAMAVFLLVNLLVETGWLVYNLVSRSARKQDFGDYHHLQVKDYRVSAAVRRPDVFWFVFDEYAASGTLRKVWHFNNPLDSLLRARQFMVADSARSNYNFTHYSLASTLDMVYLDALRNHSVVTLRDLVRGTYSIYDNNVLQVFEKTGYAVNNFTIFNFKDHVTRGMFSFADVPKSLIDYQTLGGRIRRDIGWNFPTLFSANKRKADSLAVIRFLQGLNTEYDALINTSILGIKSAAAQNTPSASLFHFMLPHEPFLYNADGTVAYKNGFSINPADYIAQVKYTNTLITRLVDTILANYDQRDVVIILQGDHGFKFGEDDPLYDTESCAILYAVYCSDKDYSPWYNTISSVNGFRTLFNKYFQTRFPLLPDTSYNLYYRQAAGDKQP